MLSNLTRGQDQTLLFQGEKGVLTDERHQASSASLFHGHVVSCEADDGLSSQGWVLLSRYLSPVPSNLKIQQGLQPYRLPRWCQPCLLVCPCIGLSFLLAGA